MLKKIEWLIEKLETKKHEKELLYPELNVSMRWYLDIAKNVVWPRVWITPLKMREGMPTGISKYREFEWHEKGLTDDEWIDEMYEEAIEDYGESLCSQSKED